MKLEYVERGIHRRGRRLIVSFALADGRIERRSVGMVSFEEARRKLLNWKRDVAMGTYQKKQPRKPEPKVVVHTVGSIWPLYLRAYRNRKKKDEGRLEIAWNRLQGMFEACRVEDVTTGLIEEYIESRQAQGMSNGTINRETATLRAMFYYATRITPPMVTRVPSFPARLPEAEPREGFVKDPEYAVLTKNAKDLWMRALIAVGYTYGFRKGELLNLHVRQVDLLDRTIGLERGTTKNNEARKVKMTTEVYELVVECCCDKNEDDYVFTRKDGSRVVDPRQEWYDLCVSSKLGVYVSAKRKTGEEFKSYRGLNLHDLRRSAIRNMTRRGVHQAVAMTISGHKTASVFRRYDITDDTDLAHASALIEAGRETQPSTRTATKTYTAGDSRSSKPS